MAGIAGLADEFGDTGEMEVVERLEGSGMTDFYSLSAKSATPEHQQMSASECERKIALLQACWTYFDDVAFRVSPELRKGPRGGGRDREGIVRHANGAEIVEFARKVGVVTPADATQDVALRYFLQTKAWRSPDQLRAHREAFCAAIREYNGRGASARTWTVQFVIRRCAYHMLDHAWEMEDRDLSERS